MFLELFEKIGILQGNSLQHEIEPGNQKDCGDNHHKKLPVNRFHEEAGTVPNRNHREINSVQDGGNHDVGIAQIHEHVVQVCAVGFEGRIAMHKTHGHHTQGVKHRQ